MAPRHLARSVSLCSRTEPATCWSKLNQSDMPLYEYECTACGHRFELIQKFSDAAIEQCPNCSELKVKKLLSSPAIQFKGTGWYITDYAKKGETKESGKESSKESKESRESRESKESGKESKESGKESKESTKWTESKRPAAATSTPKASGE